MMQKVINHFFCFQLQMTRNMTFSCVTFADRPSLFGVRAAEFFRPIGSLGIVFSRSEGGRCSALHTTPGERQRPPVRETESLSSDAARRNSHTCMQTVINLQKMMEPSRYHNLFDTSRCQNCFRYSILDNCVASLVFLS